MKAVVSFSGGLDSTTLLYECIQQFGVKEVAAISFHYHQRHARELQSASRITSRLDIQHTIISLSNTNSDGQAIGGPLTILKGSSQSDPTVAVPEGHYEDPTMRLTFVPNRNMIMLSLASAYAISLGAAAVYFAAHAGDHAIYPDCREPFVDAFNEAVGIGNYSPVRVVAPYLHSSKADIAWKAVSLRVPIEDTWSCYIGDQVHCGRCGTCVERILALEEAGAFDPTVYQGGREYALSQKKI